MAKPTNCLGKQPGPSLRAGQQPTTVSSRQGHWGQVGQSMWLLVTLSGYPRRKLGLVERGCGRDTLSCRNFLEMRVGVRAPLQNLYLDPLPCFQPGVRTLQPWLKQIQNPVEKREGSEVKVRCETFPILFKKARSQVFSSLVCQSVRVLRGVKVGHPPHSHKPKSHKALCACIHGNT